MPDVSETLLPGVGVRHEFVTASGERVAVLTHHTGRRELAIYDRADPDRCTTVLHLSAEDTRTLGELLGASHVSEAVTAVQQRLEGLAIDWVTIPDGSAAVGTTIAEGAFRTRTGTSPWPWARPTAWANCGPCWSPERAPSRSRRRGP